MANNNISLTSLDFDTLRQSMRDYLASQVKFKDYDFDGSNISVLLDVMAYNTYMGSFYNNMIGSEMFLDSAQLPDSIASHAKELNYVPRSTTSATANVDIVITPDTFDESQASIIVPKGTSFTARDSDASLPFTLSKNIIAGRVANSYVITGADLTQGSYVTESYGFDAVNKVPLILQNKLIDISDIDVTVLEDNGSTITSFKRVLSLFGLTSASEVYFIQPSNGGKYEIVFGDGVMGRVPKHNSVIKVTYRVTAGESGNGLRLFKTDGAIGGYANVVVSVNTSASGGGSAESSESIKFNAPRHMTTQERAVTSEDYETLLSINYPEISAVSAYGGEDAIPPQYGKVFIAVDLKNVDGLPDSKNVEYTRFLSKRSSLTVEPILIEPDYLYLDITSTVKYNVNLTTLSEDDIKALARAYILGYNEVYLNNFKRTLRYSPFVRAIDAAHPSIISNITEVNAMKKIVPVPLVAQSFTIDFGLALEDDMAPYNTVHDATDRHTIWSTAFQYANHRCVITDDGNGRLIIAALVGSNHIAIQSIGSVDYQTGIVQVTDFKPTSIEGGVVKVYVRPKDKDIAASRKSIIGIQDADISVFAKQVRE